MKISRIDVIGQNGNDGAAYDGLGAEWLAQSGLLDEGGAGSDRNGQDGLLDQMEMRGTQGRGAAEEGPGIAGSCARDCAPCGCGGVEGEGE